MSSSHGTAAQNSAITGGCKPVASWIKLCPNDFAAVVGISFFVCYVLWGFPLTLRLFNVGKKLAHHVFALLSCGRPNRARSTADSDDDVEFRIDECDDQTLDLEYQDPYHSPTRQLHAYLASTTLRIVPIPSPTHDIRDTLRLKQYRFPPGSPSPEGTPQSDGGLFDVSCYPSSESDSDSSSVVTFVSSSTGACIHTKRNTSEELDALVMGLHQARNRPASETSFDTIGFLDSYGYAAADNSEDLVDYTLKGERGALKWPESPPPAYLELRPADHPGRTTRPGIRL